MNQMPVLPGVRGWVAEHRCFRQGMRQVENASFLSSQWVQVWFGVPPFSVEARFKESLW
jgi:hypothetical protein